MCRITDCRICHDQLVLSCNINIPLLQLIVLSVVYGHWYGGTCIKRFVLLVMLSFFFRLMIQEMVPASFLLSIFSTATHLRLLSNDKFMFVYYSDHRNIKEIIKMSRDTKEVTRINMPPTSNQAILKWCTLYNLREDFREDPYTPIELMNMLTLRMWDIEDCNPNWDTKVLPLQKPYFKKIIKN